MAVVWTEMPFDVRGQRRMGILVPDYKKATVTEITTQYCTFSEYNM